MTFGRLLLRNLLFHWRGNLAVLLGVAVGTAVLAGALLVGDSQRESLRALALRRLDWIDQALIAPRFFREELAATLEKDDAAEKVVPALILQGSLSSKSGFPPRSAGKVTVYGVGPEFLGKDTWPSGQDVVYLNTPLARALNVEEGDAVELHLQKESAVPREALLGRRDGSAVRETITLKARILSEGTPSADFSLNPSPEAPRNAFVPLDILQSRLGQENRVNALLVAGAREDIQETLEKRLTLEDWNLKVHQPRRIGRTFPPDYLSLDSPRLILEPAVADAVQESGLKAAPTLVYMVNNIAGKRHVLAAVAAALAPAPVPLLRPVEVYYGSLQVPYSIVAAVDLDSPASLEKTLRQEVANLQDDEIILVDWEGNPLRAGKGDDVILTYFQPDDGGRLAERSRVFRVAAVVPLEGPLDDPNLTPQVRGITDVRTYQEWDPPFPYDRTRIPPGSVHEDYWSKHRTAPKAYVSLKAGREMWRSRFGDLTSFRIQPPAGENPEQIVEKRISAHLDAEAGGFVFDNVKEHALKASSGGTDFAVLFLSFSFFLILSALLLVGLLFRLNIDRRASEVGVLLASGLRRGTVRWLLLAEGCVLAALGGLVGIGAAVLYGAFLIGRLRQWWPGGLDASVLQLHVSWTSLLIGYAAAVVVSALTIAWAVRVLGKVSPRALLHGQTTEENVPGAVSRPRWSLWVCAAALIGAAGCLVAGWFVKNPEARAGTFFGSGMLLLIAGLAGLTVWMRAGRQANVGGHGAGAVARLGVRNAARHRVRSLLTAGLLASAAFLLVGVEPFRRQAGADYLDRDAGSGGFALLAESDVPIFVDLNSAAGHAEILDKLTVLRQEAPAGADLSALPTREEARELLRDVRFFAFRVRAGDDASCLNLYQPRRPRLLGVPAELIEEGGFAFGSVREPRDNPWRLLQADAGEVVPVFGDQETVTWMLGLGLGETLTVPDGRGRERTLRIDGLLHDSIFQSGLLMSERSFLDLYPRHEGYNFFLIRVDPAKADAVEQLLEAALVDRGFEVTPTVERLQQFLNVRNMYLDAFQALGGMGLLLGTLGLAVVLLRSVWERRGELALLRALGYRRGALGWLVLAENSFLLLLGLGVGTAAALASVAPHVAGSGGRVAWPRLAAMLALSLAAGLLASAAATAATVRAALVPALRRE